MLFLSDFSKTGILSTYIKKYSIIKFNENPSIGSRIVPCEQTSMTKLTVAYPNFANVLKIEHFRN
jgi:hypothetical protein